MSAAHASLEVGLGSYFTKETVSFLSFSHIERKKWKEKVEEGLNTRTNAINGNTSREPLVDMCDHTDGYFWIGGRVEAVHGIVLDLKLE